MALHGLYWRIGVPFLLLVLAETATLAVYMSSTIASEERARFERLAETNATFIRQSSLPLTEGLARDLQRVLGHQVWFRGMPTVPAAEDAATTATLAAIPTDGAAHRHGTFDYVAVDIGRNRALVLVREVTSELFDPRVVQVLVAFWLLAILIAWLAVRALVRPLRSLAAKLPSIESTTPLAVPEADRNDEIGDVARAFLATRRALHDERELRQRMEKVAVLGRMTASLAHEVQNPVAAIKLHAQLLDDRASDGAARVIESEAARIESILNQWLFVSRPEPPALAERDLAELVQQVVRSNEARLDHARVETAVTQEGDIAVPCDGKRLVHVFDNLLANAIQAMPHGGKLDISLRGEGPEVRVEFADCGTGFSPDALARFGEYFYSEREGGMGIGLGVAREIVEAHGGTIRADNRAGGGACVTVVLPRDPRGAT